jgi:hypothetical protein
LTASIPAPAGNMFNNQHRALEVANAQIDHVTVTGSATATNSYGFWLNTGSNTIDNSTVMFPPPGGQDGVITNSTSDVQVEDSSITALQGFLLRGPDAATNSIKRTSIKAEGATGVDLQKGTLDLESSLIDLGSSSSIGVRSANSIAAAETATLNLDHATIVGSNASAEGLRIQAIDAGAADTRTANLTNSVVSLPGTAIRRSADQMDTANVTTSYSNYNPAGNVSFNGTDGNGAITETNQTNFVPGFVNPGTDYHLLSSSLLIDRGDPTALSLAEPDIDGGPRAVEGPDNMCPSASDIGADEFVGTPIIDCLPPETSITSGPAAGATITSNTPTFAFTATETPATFQCSIDGALASPCLSPLTTPALADGSHTFSVQASDMSANLDPTPANSTFTIDTRPPTASTPAAPVTTVTKKCKKKKRPKTAVAAKKCKKKRR